MNELNGLYIVGTPIGNLADISYRAIQILQKVDIIAAEDTRNTKILLNHYNINTPLISYHEHNKILKSEYLLNNFLGQNKTVAIVSDAGMPLICDPGFELIDICYKNGILVTTIPGPTALISAAILSAFDIKSFIFEGFLSTNQNKKIEKLKTFVDEIRAVIIYEAPHRLLKTLHTMLEILGEKRQIAICKELTKIHETILKFDIKSAIEYFENNIIRGEFVIVIKGRDIEELTSEKREEYLKLNLKDHLRLYLDKGMTKKEAIKNIAKDRGVRKHDIYNELIKYDI